MNRQAIGQDVLTELELASEDENAMDVYCWRMEQLVDAGYAHVLADALAGDRQVDLHLACGLLARGCPPALAYRIVS